MWVFAPMHPTIITRAPAPSPSPCPRLLTPPGYIFALCSCYHHHRKLSMCSCIYNPSPPSKFYRVSTTFKTYAQNVIIVCSLTHPFAPITNILVVGLLSEFTTCCDDQTISDVNGNPWWVLRPISNPVCLQGCPWQFTDILLSWFSMDQELPPWNLSPKPFIDRCRLVAVFWACT